MSTSPGEACAAASSHRDDVHIGVDVSHPAELVVGGGQRGPQALGESQTGGIGGGRRWR